MSSNRDVLAFLLVMDIFFSFTLKASAEDKSKNKWVDVIKIDPKSLRAKQFDTFLVIPKGTESLSEVYVAISGNGVYYYNSDSGKQWIDIGLKDKKVYQLIRHHSQSNESIYACTNRGLHLLNRKTWQWDPVGTALQDSQVLAMAFDSNDDSLLYAATPNHLFRSLDRGVIWQTLTTRSKKTDLPQIRALVILPDSSHLLLAGTNQGIYKIRILDEIAIWSDISIAGSPLNVNFFIACEYAKRHTLIIATENNGIFYSRDGEIWTSLNVGLRQPFLSVVGLSIDQKLATKSCFMTYSDGTIKKLRLVGSKVGIFNIYSPNVSLWETKQISDRLFSRLSVPDVLDLTRVDTSLDVSEEDLRNFLINNPKLKSYDKILIGAVKLKPLVAKFAKEQQKIRVEIKAYNVRTNSFEDYSSKEDGLEKYYPCRIDRLAKEIKKKEFGIDESSWFYQCFLKGWWRKTVTGAGIAGISVLGALALAPCEKKSCETKSRLPIPPPFPE
ncbi:hypothetical protein L0337_03200 [candidate division KSB1 bacterium]|nr:hypothetical protein [candidate division KSB1 bacterium]